MNGEKGDNREGDFRPLAALLLKGDDIGALILCFSDAAVERLRNSKGVASDVLGKSIFTEDAPKREGPARMRREVYALFTL